jgi:hypothetical protein
MCETNKYAAKCEVCDGALPPGKAVFGLKVGTGWSWLCGPCRNAALGHDPRKIIEAYLCRGSHRWSRRRLNFQRKKNVVIFSAPTSDNTYFRLSKKDRYHGPEGGVYALPDPQSLYYIKPNQRPTAATFAEKGCADACSKSEARVRALARVADAVRLPDREALHGGADRHGVPALRGQARGDGRRPVHSLRRGPACVLLPRPAAEHRTDARARAASATRRVVAAVPMCPRRNRVSRPTPLLAPDTAPTGGGFSFRLCLSDGPTERERPSPCPPAAGADLF